MKISFSRQFKIAYKARIEPSRTLQKLFADAIERFMQDPNDPALRTHKLHGILSDHFAFSVDYDCRVIFRRLGDSSVLLVDIGSHDEVY